MNKPIVVLGPMLCEMDEFLNAMTDVKVNKIGGYTFYEGKYKDKDMVVVNCLIGMVNSATATTLAITKYNPRCIIIQGTSGGHDPALHQGDIVIGENIIELGSYYTQHRDEGEGSNYLDWEFPGEEMPENSVIFRVRTLHSDKELVKVADSIPYAAGKKVHGTISTADIWHKEIDKILYFNREFGSSCEEMETFAVGQVCRNLPTPFLGVRVLSNSELYPEELFDEKYARLLQHFVLDIIEKI